MTDEKKEVKKKDSNDDLWAIVRAIKNVLEVKFGVDLDRDGKVGSVKVGALMLVALLSIGVCAYAYDLTVLKDASETTVYAVDDSGNVTASGAITGASVYVTGEVEASNLSTTILAAQTDTNQTIDVTIVTPRRVGDVLVGTGSNLVYVAVGATTNDWVLVTN